MKNIKKGSPHSINQAEPAQLGVRNREANEEEGSLIPQTVQDTTYERNMLHQLVKCSLYRFP